MEAADDVIHPLLGTHPVVGGGAGDLQAVFVDTGDRVHLFTDQPPVPRHGVGNQGGVGGADVGAVVGVVDRGGEVLHGPPRVAVLPPGSRGRYFMSSGTGPGGVACDVGLNATVSGQSGGPNNSGVPTR